MITVYIAYWNNVNTLEITPLRLCENYTEASNNFQDIAIEFAKIYYDGQIPPHPIKICKYEEKVNDSAPLAISLFKSDSTFTSGLLFVKKKHDACVYEKICYPGTVYNSYVVKYIGRIGVVMQDLPIQTEIIAKLKENAALHESKIQKLEAEVKRLEYTNQLLESTQKTLLSRRETFLAEEHRPEKPKRKLSDQPPTEEQNLQADLLKELTNSFKNGITLRKKSCRKTGSTDSIIEGLISEIEKL